MAGDEDPSSAISSASADPCPLCGGPARVTLAKRRLFHLDSITSSRLDADEASSSSAVPALRESLARQRRAVAGLQAELEAERAAAADAASEAMSMILRLQRDKSEAMMDARQYRRYAEERFAHHAAEADALRAAVGRRDNAVRALSARLRECQARLLCLGYDPPPSPSSPFPSSPSHARRQSRHRHPEIVQDEDHASVLDDPAPADVGTPRTHHLLNNRAPAHDEDPPICGSPRHLRAQSGDSFSYDVALADDDDEEYLLYPTTDRDAPGADDGEMDRVYTVDAVHGVPWDKEEEEEAEIQKLKARLQALEADRESMRHAIMTMGDEKAQVVLLREIALQLCKEGTVFPPVPTKVQPRLQPVVVAQRKMVKRKPCFIKVFIVAVIKWIASFFCWRKKSNHIKYPIGLCGSNVGLMLVLDRYPKQRRRKFLKNEPSADIH